MIIKNAEFVISVANASNRLQDTGIEIAVAGKSNVGKSSFINCLANNGKLARTSKDPGRTRLINYFKFNKGDFYLVDLPGYGYAKVSNQEKQKWDKLMDGYLRSSENLKNVFVLVDIRHEPSVLDIQMINYLTQCCIPLTIILTKADKLSKAQRQRAVKTIANCLRLPENYFIVTSSVDKTGFDKVLEKLQQIIDAEKLKANLNLEDLTPQD